MNDCSLSAQRIRGALGLAMRAGAVISGAFAVEKALKARRALLALIDPSASSNTKSQWQYACAGSGIPIIEIPDMGKAIGKPERMIAVITDERFASMINKYIIDGHKPNSTGVVVDD